MSHIHVTITIRIDYHNRITKPYRKSCYTQNLSKKYLEKLSKHLKAQTQSSKDLLSLKFLEQKEITTENGLPAYESKITQYHGTLNKITQLYIKHFDPDPDTIENEITSYLLLR